jgi:hypothetical protein
MIKGAITLEELANEILKTAWDSVHNPTPEVQKMIDEKGINYAYAVVLQKGIYGAGGSGIVTYDGGKPIE